MARTPREWVRTAVGIASVAPALGLLVLAGVLVAKGGLGGLLGGIVVAGVAFLLMAIALGMTHAPVSIAGMLRRTDEERAERDRPRERGDGVDPETGVRR